MQLKDVKTLELPASADFHVHLRDGAMMETVVPTIRQGGVDVVFVMPNLTPPITTVAHALDYKKRLQKLEPSVTFLMSLYLHPDITPETIAEASNAGITGVKSYPAGVTTNSKDGVLSYKPYYPVFKAMETHNMILNLHGEVPSDSSDHKDITVLNAEAAFLPQLLELHREFPDLRIILEHCTTAAALEAVASCGPTVAATITAHHLFLTVDDWCADPFSFCKPVAKTPEDRRALLKAVVSGNSKYFFGSDSAPHPVAAKKTAGHAKTAAGCFTQGWATQLVVGALEIAQEKKLLDGGFEVTKETLTKFLSENGRNFYKAPAPTGSIVLEKKGEEVDEYVKSADGEVVVVPFRTGEETWSLRWN
jgi:dihydroorotase